MKPILSPSKMKLIERFFKGHFEINLIPNQHASNSYSLIDSKGNWFGNVWQEKGKIGFHVGPAFKKEQDALEIIQFMEEQIGKVIYMKSPLSLTPLIYKEAKYGDIIKKLKSAPNIEVKLDSSTTNILVSYGNNPSHYVAQIWFDRQKNIRMSVRPKTPHHFIQSVRKIIDHPVKVI